MNTQSRMAPTYPFAPNSGSDAITNKAKGKEEIDFVSKPAQMIAKRN
jgi:hypothetical protein